MPLPLPFLLLPFPFLSLSSAQMANAMGKVCHPSSQAATKTNYLHYSQRRREEDDRPYWMARKEGEGTQQREGVVVALEVICGGVGGVGHAIDVRERRRRPGIRCANAMQSTEPDACGHISCALRRRLLLSHFLPNRDAPPPLLLLLSPHRQSIPER